LGARCVADAGLGARGMAIGDNPNDGPCPFPDSSWLGAGGSDAKLPTTTYRTKKDNIIHHYDKICKQAIPTRQIFR